MLKNTVWGVVSIIILLVSTLGAVPPSGVNLAVLQGWDIVIAEDTSASEKYAAEEFQHFFAEA